MDHISDIKLIRTDTTLDLSQKAEKGMNRMQASASLNSALVIIEAQVRSLCADENHIIFNLQTLSLLTGDYTMNEVSIFHLRKQFKRNPPSSSVEDVSQNRCLFDDLS
ncbi:hypothetical protein YC2023_078284 [Brassica napus]